MTRRSDTMRPFWRYYGGKWRIARRYPAPLDGVPIVEPFAGAAGYSTKMGADREVILIERDPKIAAIWRWLIGASPDDVLSLPDIPDGGTVDDLDVPGAARWLIGFWCNNGASQPCKSASKWTTMPGRWFGWGQKARTRIAAQVPRIRSWSVIEGDYTEAPDIRATWFVDPPYSTPAGRHYRFDAVDFDALGQWCRTREGLTIVCEQMGARWLPFRHLVEAKTSRHGKPSREVIWTGVQ